MLAAVDFASFNVELSFSDKAKVERDIYSAVIEEDKYPNFISSKCFCDTSELVVSLAGSSSVHLDNYLLLLDTSVSSFESIKDELVDVFNLSSSGGILDLFISYSEYFDSDFESSVWAGGIYYQPAIYVSAVAVEDIVPSGLELFDVFSIQESINFAFNFPAIGIMPIYYSGYSGVLESGIVFDNLYYINNLAVSSCDLFGSLKANISYSFVFPYVNRIMCKDNSCVEVVYGECDFGELRREFNGDLSVEIGTTDFNVLCYIGKARNNIRIPIPDVEYDVDNIVLPDNVSVDYNNKVLTIKLLRPESQVVTLKDTDGNNYYVKIIPMFSESRIQFKRS